MRHEESQHASEVRTERRVAETDSITPYMDAASRHSSEDEVDAVIAQCIRRRPWFDSPGFLLTGALGLAILAAACRAWLSNSDTQWVIDTVSVACGLAGALSTQRWIAKLDMLLKADNVRTLGTLVDMMAYLRPRRQRKTRHAVSQLLYRLQPGDGALLNGGQRRWIRRLMSQTVVRSQEDYSEFIMAVLKAYEVIGDRSDLAVVDRLARGIGWANNSTIREAAQACGSRMRERMEQENAPQVLLRASTQSGVASETLLRAVQGAVESNPHGLLRAGTEPDSDVDRNLQK